jgi:hypothetical protein
MRSAINRIRTCLALTRHDQATKEKTGREARFFVAR